MCSHEVVDDVCVACGLCMSFDQDYVHPYVPQQLVVPARMKYAVLDSSRRYDRSIESVLSILGVSGYSSEVRGILLSRTFHTRTSISDRVLSVAYHVLRRSQYPVSYSDMLPYTERSGAEFKRILLREFGHAETSSEYLINMLHRVQESLGLGGSSCSVEFVSLVRANRSTSPQRLCIAYLVRSENLADCHRRLCLDRFMTIGALRGMVRRISGESHQTRKTGIDAAIRKHFIGSWKRIS